MIDGGLGTHKTLKRSRVIRIYMDCVLGRVFPEGGGQFGSPALAPVHEDTPSQHKLLPRSERCRFLGYGPRGKGHIGASSHVMMSFSMNDPYINVSSTMPPELAKRTQTTTSHDLLTWHLKRFNLWSVGYVVYFYLTLDAKRFQPCYHCPTLLHYALTL